MKASENVCREDALIIACSRTVMPEFVAGLVRNFANDRLDWHYVKKASIKHGVLPLVYRNLQAGGAGVPAETLDGMRKDSLYIVARNLYLAKVLLDTLRLFQDNGIFALPFKGPVLAENVYGDLTLRMFNDLDILVSPEDSWKAIELLTERGYIPYVQLSRSQLNAYQKTEDDMIMVHSDGKPVIELHWEMTGRVLPEPMDLELVGSRLRATQVLDVEVPDLSNEDLLIYLCIHGSRHMWERLEWICCIAELIRASDNLRWDDLFERAKSLRCRPILKHGLLLAYRLFDAALPESVVDNLKSDDLQAQLAECVANSLFPLYIDGQKEGHGNRFSGLQFKLRETYVDKVRYGWLQLTGAREADWRWLALPACLAFCYRSLRPLRLCLQSLSWR